MAHHHVPVLVVGGGYAGLSAAMLLAWRGVPVTLVERHPGTSVQPKAFGVNQRALELLRVVPGIEEALADLWTGIGDSVRIAIAPTLNHPDAHVIVDQNEDFSFMAEATPVPTVGAPQAEIERLLRRRAEELGADLRFSTELTDLRQDPGGVTATLTDLREGTGTTLRADYVIAADGYRSPLRGRLGIPVSGKGELGQICSIMFDADLSDLVRDREVTLWYLRNDAMTGILLTGTGVGSHGLGVNFDAAAGESEDDFTPERCTELIRIATDRPDLEVKLLDRTSFAMAHQVASRYRAGRVFLAGDAAHTMPPTGGQGGSVALQDGADLAWRLWLVVTGQAGPAFLDTYDAERRPYGTLMADAQLANLGMRMPPAARIGYPEPIDDPTGAILGARYHSTAVLEEPDDDGSLLEDPRHPTGRPGSRAPHVVLERDGHRLSMFDLFGNGFVLLTDDGTLTDGGALTDGDGSGGGRAWADATDLTAQRLGVSLTCVVIGDEVTDVKGNWHERYGVNTGGAVLVRPDGYIAWRSPGPIPDPATTLESTLRHILNR